MGLTGRESWPDTLGQRRMMNEPEGHSEATVQVWVERAVRGGSGQREEILEEIVPDIQTPDCSHGDGEIQC